MSVQSVEKLILFEILRYSGMRVRQSGASLARCSSEVIYLVLLDSGEKLAQ